LTFGTLDASNQGRDIKKVLFLSPLAHMIGCIHRCLIGFLLAIPALYRIFAVFCRHLESKHGFFIKAVHPLSFSTDEHCRRHPSKVRGLGMASKKNLCFSKVSIQRKS
jgi:hypothetical protein